MVDPSVHEKILNEITRFVSYLNLASNNGLLAQSKRDYLNVVKESEANIKSVNLSDSQAPVLIYSNITSIARQFSEDNWYADMMFYNDSKKYINNLVQLAVALVK